MNYEQVNHEMKTISFFSFENKFSPFVSLCALVRGNFTFRLFLLQMCYSQSNIFSRSALSWKCVNLFTICSNMFNPVTNLSSNEFSLMNVRFPFESPKSIANWSNTKTYSAPSVRIVMKTHTEHDIGELMLRENNKSEKKNGFGGWKK